MELEEPFQKAQTVDAEVRAYVYSLVNALGGTGADDEGRYVLGDDALACLRDIKRWLKLYDEKTNRLDVARCLAEANLVNGDLLPILASWPEEATSDRLKSRIALACLELLVPLTWPIETNAQMTVNHARHTPYLQRAQLSFKRGILGSGSGTTLRTAIRLALPSMATPRADRSPRDEGIIKLVLYFLRNVAVISPSPGLHTEEDENEVSRSANIEAFHYQDVFALLLTMCSNVGEDFNLQDVILLETLFHLIKGVDAERLFMDDAQRSDRKRHELKDLLRKESSMRRDYAKIAPTRHGRFGTMIWVKRDEEKVSTVSGQDILKDGRHAYLKMDKTKKWTKPKQRSKADDFSIYDFDMPTVLTSSASHRLRTFVEEFVDSGFNPLFTSLRKAMEREAERVEDVHYRQFFYAVAWFLQAERCRRASQLEAHRHDKPGQEFEVDSYALVASVLNQETFIFLNRYMQSSYDNREWQNLNANMHCFTQILLTVQEMTQSPLDEDQEIADNIQNRIFYEETTHDRIISILRGYKDQGFGYLDACTELSHVFVRLLERYSKENGDLQIRSRRKARKRKARAQSGADNNDRDDEMDSEAEDEIEAARVSRERKFDFNRFAAKFSSQGCVNAFVSFTSFYRDLNVERLKRAHRFFYRVAFKQEMSTLLYRLDIIALFHKMIEGPEGLDLSNTMFKEWEELVRQVIKRLIKKLDQRPELVVELLFSKINSTLYYLEYGHEKQTLSSTKPPPELEINSSGILTQDEKLGVVVAALIQDEKSDLVKWVIKMLEAATDERKSWEAEHEARRADGEGETLELNAPAIVVRPHNDSCRTAMFRNSKLRLLMTLIGFERLGVEDVLGATWIIPSGPASQDFQATQQIIKKHEKDPPREVNGLDVGALVRRKREVRDDELGPSAAFIDDSEGSDGNEEFLFPANSRSKSKQEILEELKTRRRKRRVRDDDEETALDDGMIEARRKAREEAALERRRKIKSDLYVHDSDDESDAEADKQFFAKEEERRQRQSTNVLNALKTGISDTAANGNKKRKMNTSSGDERNNRKNEHALDSGSDDELALFEGYSSTSKRKTSMSSDKDSKLDTPLSSQDDIVGGDVQSMKPLEADSMGTKAPLANNDGKNGAGDDEDSDVPVLPTARRRIRAGFIIDSDSE